LPNRFAVLYRDEHALFKFITTPQYGKEELYDLMQARGEVRNLAAEQPALTALFRDKVRTRFQLNPRNLQEWKTRLDPVGAYPDGSAHTFRIVEPGTFIFTTTFDL